MSIDIFVDLDRKFTKTSDGNIKKTNSMETINQSIKNILSTVPGERVMLPTFGSHIRFLLFEPMEEDTVILIENEIKNRIGQWEDRVRVSAVIITPDYDRNVYKISVRYVYLVTNIQYSLETTLKNFV